MSKPTASGDGTYVLSRNLKVPTRFGLEEMSGEQWYEDRSTGFMAVEELVDVHGEVADFLN
ncbi:hypothetical protein GJ744_007647 [Endocarpon pusillum]|uniref:Uncharacterized protein n=1 Tax=Endocarpon pusillum TaxID=364733 RepID=A0A8H7AK52_9EURO|nr:hypothetical protein GJ744_007647 [Endocarpon pusillum]